VLFASSRRLWWEMIRLLKAKGVFDYKEYYVDGPGYFFLNIIF